MIFGALDYAQLAGGLGVLMGAAGGIYGTYRRSRKDHTEDIVGGAAVLLGGWKEFQATTREEMDRMREDFQRQIADLKSEHAADRAELSKELRAKDVKIQQLETQIRILLEAQHRGG